MRAIALYSRRRGLLTQEAVSHEVSQLNKIALVRLLELRVFNDLLEGNVLGGRSVLPSPELARNMIVDTHSANKRGILIFLTFIADQVCKTLAGLHGSVNAIEQTFKSAVLIVFCITNVEDSNAAVLKPVGDLKGRVKNLRALVSGKPANDTSGATARQKLSGMKLIVQRDAVDVPKVFPPALEAIKNLVPLFAWNTNSGEDVNRAFC